MKNVIKTLLVTAVFVGLLYGLWDATTEASKYPPPCKQQTWLDPNTFPFVVDKSKIVGYSLGYLATKVGDTLGHEINYCDPDGDPMVLDVNNIPANGVVGGSLLSWSPVAEQACRPYYIYITVIDFPGPNSLPLSTTGTIILYAYERNERPVIDVCP